MPGDWTTLAQPPSLGGMSFIDSIIANHHHQPMYQVQAGVFASPTPHSGRATSLPTAASYDMGGFWPSPMQALSPSGLSALSASPHYPFVHFQQQPGMWPMPPFSVYGGGHTIGMNAPMQPGPARASSPLRHVSSMRQSSPVRQRNAKAGVAPSAEPVNGSRKSGGAHRNTGVKAFGVAPLRQAPPIVEPAKKGAGNLADPWANAWHDENSNPLTAVRPDWSASLVRIGGANLWDHAWHDANSSPYAAERPKWG